MNIDWLEKDSDVFFNALSDMCKTLMKRVQSSVADTVELTITSPVKDDPSCGKKLRLPSQALGDIQLFSFQGETMERESWDMHLVRDGVFRLILCLRYIWYDNVQMGVKLEILQMQKMRSPLPSMFAVPSPSLHDKYMKMSKTGVPLAALEQRMRLDGVDEGGIRALLMQLQQKPQHPNLPQPPPLPPPLPPRPSMSDVFAQLGGVKLKASALPSPQVAKAIQPAQPSPFSPPALDDILDAKKRLKSHLNKNADK